MIATQNTKLNVVPGGIIPVVHVSQYDVDRVLSFTLYDGNGAASIESGTTVTIEGTKPDGNGFQYAGALSGNVLTVNTTVQMTAIEGTNECKLTLKKGTQTIGSALFLMEVEKAGINENTPVSETDLPLIIAQATEQMERAEAAAANAENSEIIAGSAMRMAGNYAEIAKQASTICTSILPVVQGYKESAENSAIVAGSFMRIAGNYSEDSEAYATGKRNGVDVPSTDPTYQNNSEYWARYAQQYAVGALHYKGVVLFANIPTTGLRTGDVYDIKDAFTTDSRFQDGAGISCDAGTNIIWNENNKWDIDIQGGGGHTILNEAGTEMPKRSKLQFNGATVTDDETNDATVVETVNPVEYEEDIQSIQNQLTEQTNILGAKNWLKNNNISQVINGITWTVNADKTVTANGTVASGKTDSQFVIDFTFGGNSFLFNGSPNDENCKIYIWDKTTNARAKKSSGDPCSDSTNNSDCEVFPVEGHVNACVLRVVGTVSNVTFKPMLRLASDPDNTYVPYAMTNRELTEKTQEIEETIGDTAIPSELGITVTGALSNIDAHNHYSTSETWTGEYDTDGKKIYKITFIVNNPTIGSYFNINGNIDFSNCNLKSISGILTGMAGNDALEWQIPYYFASNEYVNIFKSNENIRIQIVNAYTISKVEVTVRYTKTT